MASRSEDLPSCSKMSLEGANIEDIVINKFPVVILKRLDPDILTQKIVTGDDKGAEKTAGLVTTDKNKSEAKKKTILDEDDGALSDISITFSDSEDTVKELTGSKSSKKGTRDVKDDKRGKPETSGPKSRNGNAVSSQKFGNQKRSGQISKKDSDSEGRSGYRQKASKRPMETAEGDFSGSKKSKTEVTVEKIIGAPRYMVLNKTDKIHNANARYKLTLGPFNTSALKSESFRKFINLAADCVVSYNRKNVTIGTHNGSVELFFGDFCTLQSAMQRLCQLPGFPDKSLANGCITCLEIKPIDKENKTWKAQFAAKLFFQFLTNKNDRLQRLITNKGQKKEDTNHKSVQLHQIPSPINEEMLTLLFPFSIGVKISDTDSTKKDLKGSVEVVYESQEWMEAVLDCFKNFAVSVTQPNDRLFKLMIKNSNLPKDKTQEKFSTGVKSKQVTGLSRGGWAQRGRTLLQARDGAKNRAMAGRNLTTFNQRALISRGGLSQNRSAVEASRLRGVIQPRRAASHDALSRIALAKGLDPGHPEVAKVVEMTAHLEQLQHMVVQQTAEARSLSIVSLQGQQAANEHQLQQLVSERRLQQLANERQFEQAVNEHQIQQATNERRLLLQKRMLALKQAQEERDAENFQAVNQMRRSREFEDLHLADSSWPHSDVMRHNWELAREREIEDRIRQEEFKAIHRQANLARELQHMPGPAANSSPRKHFQKVAQRSPKGVPNIAGNLANKSKKKIMPFGDAPPTKGLLGAGPPVLPESNVPDMGLEARDREEIYPQRAALLNQNYKRKAENQWAAGRRSAWNDDQGMEEDYATGDDMGLDPGRNDRPLDFNRPLPRLSAEQAFKQDIERTKAALGGQQFKPGLLGARRPLVEDVRERHALPLQFGKNAVKKTPKEIEEQRRRDLEMNIGMERNARNFSGVKKAANNFPSVGDGSIRGAPHNRAPRENLVPARGAPRGRPLQRGQPQTLRNQSQLSAHTNTSFHQEPSRSREADHAWQVPRERQEFYEYDQEDPQGYFYPETDANYRKGQLKRPRVSGSYQDSQEFSAHAKVAAKPSLAYEEGQFDSYYVAEEVKKPYEVRETLRRAEVSYGYGYGEYEEDYAGNEGGSARYPAGTGNVIRPTGRGGAQARGGSAAHARGGLAQRGGSTARARGGLAQRGGSTAHARGGLAQRGGMTARVDHGQIERSTEPARGRRLPGARGNAERGRAMSGRGDGLLPNPHLLEDSYYREGNGDAYMEEAREDFRHFEPHHQQAGRGRIAGHLAQPPPLLGHRGGSRQGVQFF